MTQRNSRSREVDESGEGIDPVYDNAALEGAHRSKAGRFGDPIPDKNNMTA